MAPNTKALLENLLKKEECKKRFNHRKEKYSCIKKYLPHRFEDIITDSPPWYHHGLGLRLATFSTQPQNENIFERLNSLLELVESLDGWKDEFQNIGKTWASNFDEFFHHLWMLQCVEYYIGQGYNVCFPGKNGKKAPDLKITKDNKTSYIECYVYSKWWFTEAFIEEIIGLIDSNLRLERTYNIKPIDTKCNVDKLLKELGKVLENSKLENAKNKAAISYPYTLYEQNGLRLLMDGKGEYQSSDNAHGDPEPSAQVYINECIAHKCTENDLMSHKPNLLMVNALGRDFQNIFSSDYSSHLFFDCCHIDELKMHSCGIDEQLATCTKSMCIPKK